MDALFKALTSPGGIGGIVALVMALALAVAALWVERAADRKRSLKSANECQAELKAVHEARIVELRLTIETVQGVTVALAEQTAAVKTLTAAIHAAIEVRYGDDRGDRGDRGGPPRGRRREPG